jgi:hypothetical protein
MGENILKFLKQLWNGFHNGWQQNTLTRVPSNDYEKAGSENISCWSAAPAKYVMGEGDDWIPKMYHKYPNLQHASRSFNKNHHLSVIVADRLFCVDSCSTGEYNGSVCVPVTIGEFLYSRIGVS